MTFAFIATHRGIWPAGWVGEARGVARAGFYAWRTRPPSLRARADEQRLSRVRARFLTSDRTDGARRVWHDRLGEGIACGLHRLERLMPHAALRARPRRRRMPSDPGVRSTHAVAPNGRNRTFDAASANRKGVADCTYLWPADGWLSVAAVLALFSRRVGGGSMSATMTAQLVTDARVMAIWRRGTPHTVLHHSDRGSQYTSEPFQRLLADHGVTGRMSRAGNVWDHAVMESFFSSLKTARTAATMYRTRVQAKAEVFDYIECVDNPRRRHSTLGYLSPMAFEMQAEFAYVGVHQTGSSPKFVICWTTRKEADYGNAVSAEETRSGDRIAC